MCSGRITIRATTHLSLRSTSRANSLGTWKVPNAKNVDWEDIAAYKDKAGKCFLYIGEIGDNKTKRHEHTVYRVAEPVIVPENSNSNRKAPLDRPRMPRCFDFTYPDYDQDAETLMVHPKTGDIYVVTKRVSGPAGVYRIKAGFWRPSRSRRRRSPRSRCRRFRTACSPAAIFRPTESA